MNKTSIWNNSRCSCSEYKLTIALGALLHSQTAWAINYYVCCWWEKNWTLFHVVRLSWVSSDMKGYRRLWFPNKSPVEVLGMLKRYSFKITVCCYFVFSFFMKNFVSTTQIKKSRGYERNTLRQCFQKIWECWAIYFCVEMDWRYRKENIQWKRNSWLMPWKLESESSLWESGKGKAVYSRRKRNWIKTVERT